METSPIDKVHMTTMNELIDNLKSKGFNNEFTVNSSGLMISSTSNGHFYKPSEVKIVDFFRFEGESDPGDEAILYALETENGTKGVMNHIYGRELSEESQFEMDFMRKVRSLHQEHPLSTGVAASV